MKQIFRLGFMLCVACVAPFAPRAGATVLQKRVSAEVSYSDGVRFALEGRLTEAADAFEEAVELNPANGNAYFSLGNVYTELARFDDAVAAYRQAIRLNKEDAEAYNGLGIALGSQRHYEEAEASFERAVKIFPKWAEPHFHLSRVRRELHHDAAAQDAYAQALRLRPDYAAHPPRTFVTALTNAVAAPRSMEPARVDAPVKVPEIVAPTSNVATNSGAASARAIAATPSNEATRLSSMDAVSYYGLGLRKASTGEHDAAVLAFRQAILLDRKNARAHLALGDAYAALGKWRESVDAYEQAARLNPEDVEIYQRLGRSYAKLRETTPALEAVSASTPLSVKAAASSNSTAGAERPVVESAADGKGGTTRATVDDVDPTSLYRVGPRDVLDIRALNGRERSMTSYEVTPTGLLDYPKLSEPLKVTGLTTEQVAARLGTELKLRSGGTEPEIVVGVREYVSHAIIINGMVKDAGTKILQREGVPLYVIIAYAQPLPGAGQALLVSRVTGRSMAIDLSDALAMKTLVRPGDVITVRALPKQFYFIAGAVRQPGQKVFHAGLTLTQALLAAGDTLSPGASVVALTRQSSGDGRLATNTYKLGDIKTGKTPDPFVQPGDRIEVLK